MKKMVLLLAAMSMTTTTTGSNVPGHSWCSDELACFFDGDERATERDDEPPGRFVEEAGASGTLVGGEFREDLASVPFAASSAEDEHARRQKPPPGRGRWGRGRQSARGFGCGALVLLEQFERTLVEGAGDEQPRSEEAAPCDHRLGHEPLRSVVLT